MAPFTLDVTFTDATTQRIPFRPVLEEPLFGPVQDLETFNAVEVHAAGAGRGTAGCSAR